jgi:predicted TIM-barrel enzyme
MRIASGSVSADPRSGPFGQDHVTIYAPIMGQFPRHLAAQMALLPLSNVNDVLAHSLSTAENLGSSDCYCGTFILDPFTRWPELLQKVRQSGFHRICNYPPLPVLGGEDDEALAASGFTDVNEIHKLADFAADGFEVAFVSRTPDLSAESLALLRSLNCPVCLLSDLSFP